MTTIVQTKHAKYAQYRNRKGESAFRLCRADSLDMNIISVQIPDNIANTFAEKLELMNKLKLRHMELSKQELSLEDVSSSEIIFARNQLIDEGCTVHLYKSSLSVSQRDSVRQLFRNAHLMEVSNVQLDLYNGSRDDIEYCFDVAESYGIPLLIENHNDGPFRNSTQLEEFLKRHNNRDCGVLFNPLEFLRTGLHPFLNVFYAGRVKNHVAALRINDGLYMSKEAVFPGRGNGELKELISAMKVRSYDGFFSLTPYLPGCTSQDLMDMITWLRQILKGIY